MNKRNTFPMNEMGHKFSKIVCLSEQYKILEIRKCYSMALVFTFRIHEIVSPILEYVLKLKKKSSLQNSLSCQTENPLKPISVSKSLMSVWSNSIARFLNFGLKIMIQKV